MRTYDPTDVSLRRNPYGLLAELRETEPVHWCPPLDAWLLTRYDDVKQAMTAPQLSSDRLRPFYESLKDERRDILSGVMRYLNEWLVFKAPPDHTRLRRMMNPVISPRLMQSMRPSVRAIVDDLLAGVSRDQPFDFVHYVAALLPAYVIMDMLGLARADFDKGVVGWSAPVYRHRQRRTRQISAGAGWCRSFGSVFARTD